ncbi:MAG TPA: hypothetical protein VHO47_00120 [Candidatus Babeliales bacterium]|nr:hypothetical protein [Candidatus Babeliales bacterium]
MNFILKLSMLSLLSFPISVLAMESDSRMGDLEKKCTRLVVFYAAHQLGKTGKVDADHMSTLNLGGRKIDNLEEYVNQADLLAALNTTISPTDSDLQKFPIHTLQLSTNNIEKVPSSFSFLGKTVKRVDLTDNQFKGLDFIPSLFPHVEEVLASSNPIAAVNSSTFEKLQSLKTIILPSATKIVGSENPKIEWFGENINQTTIRYRVEHK